MSSTVERLKTYVCRDDETKPSRSVTTTTLKMEWVNTGVGGSWSARAFHGVVRDNDDTLYLVGGENETGLLNDVWTSSTRGRTWTRVSASAAFRPRSRFGLVVMKDNTLLLLGGRVGLHEVSNDIWKSEDGGRSWKEVLIEGERWEAREQPIVAVLDDDSIILTGGIGDKDSSVSPTVWRSTDMGQSWSKWSSAPEWKSPRPPVTGRILQTPYYILLLDTFQRRVWMSNDSGQNWTLTKKDAPWFLNAESTIFPTTGVITVLGGESLNQPFSNDVYQGFNAGADWTVVPSFTTPTQWKPRVGHAAVTFDTDTIVFVGGKTSSSYVNDTWRGTSL